jgi:hypothetical protein
MLELLHDGIDPIEIDGQELSIVSRELKKVKLNKSGGLDVLIHISVLNPDSETPHTIVLPIENGVPVHADMHAVLRRLAAHLALMDERVEYDSNDKELRLQLDEGVKSESWPLKSYHVRGVILKGEEDSDKEGVQINGMKILKTGKPVNILTPFVKLNEEKTDYAHAVSLANALADLRLEVRNYFGGKIAKANQIEMAFDEDE